MQFANYIGITKDILTAAEIATLHLNPHAAIALNNLAFLADVPIKNHFIDRSPNAATVSLSGSIAYTGYPEIPPTTSVATTAYTALITDSVILVDDDTAAATVTITLPAAATAGDGFELIIFKKGSTADIIIEGDGSETINGELNVTLIAKYESIKIITDGTEWFIIEA